MKAFAETRLDIDEETRRRLILIIEEDLLHGEGTMLMGEVLAALMYCDRIVLEN